MRSCRDDLPNTTPSEVREEVLGGCGCGSLKDLGSYVLAAQETCSLLGSQRKRDACLLCLPASLC